MLAESLYKYPNETRADLQRYYNLNIDELGTRFTAEHAGACLFCLPIESALFASIAGTSRWSLDTIKLNQILNLIAGKQISPYPWDSESEQNDKEVEETTLPLGRIEIDKFDEWYNQEWEEVEYGGYTIEGIPHASPQA